MRLPGPQLSERPLRFERVTTRQGLSQNMVFDAVQDALGFMWFGTQDGLNRYDGSEFKTFDRVLYDSTSLAGSLVLRLFPTADGGLWVSTDGGLQRYNPSTESFERVRAKAPASADSTYRRRCVSCYPVSVMHEDREGELWLGSGIGLARFDHASQSEQVYQHDPEDETSLSNSVVTNIHEDNDGDLWVATINGVNKFNRDSQTFDRFLSEPDYSPQGLTNMMFGEPPVSHLRPMLAAAFADDPMNPGMLWVATLDGLVHLDKTSGRSSRYRPPADGDAAVFTDVALDPNHPNLLWLTTATAGLFRFDSETGDFRNYSHDPEDETTIGTNRLSSIVADEHGRPLDRHVVGWSQQA